MEKIIFFLLFILPFIIFPIGTSPFEAPKVYITEIAIIILFIWYIAKQPALSLRQKKYLPYYLIFLLSFIHLFTVPSTTLVFGNVFRMQGVFFLWLLLLFSILSSKIVIKLPSIRILTFLIFLHVLAAVLIQAKIDDRAIGTLGEANSLAANTIFLFSFLLFLPFQKKDWWYKAISFIFILFILLFTGSRSGIIAFCIVSIFYLLQRFSLRAAFIVAVLLFCSSLVLPFLQQNQLFENRATVWQTAFAAGFAKPLLGWGFGNTELALAETAQRENTILQYEYVDSSHNVFLDFWVQGGLIGLASIAFLVTTAYYHFMKQKKLLELAILFGLLIMLSFNPLSVAVLVQFWWVVGRGAFRN